MAVGVVLAYLARQVPALVGRLEPFTGLVYQFESALLVGDVADAARELRPRASQVGSRGRPRLSIGCRAGGRAGARGSPPPLKEILRSTLVRLLRESATKKSDC